MMHISERAVAAALALALCGRPVAGQNNGTSTGITVGSAVHISAGHPGDPYAETFLAINPRNNRNLIATSIVVRAGEMRCDVYASFDGGRTWEPSRGPVGDTLLLRGGDPVVYFDAAGTGFAGSLSGHGFVLSRSTDGGRSWQTPMQIPGGTYDREYVAFDHTGGPFNGRMYAAGTISVFELNGKRQNGIEVVYSTDSGKTFSAGRTYINGEVGEKTFVFVIADLLVTPDGKLILPFSTYEGEQHPDSSRDGHLWTMVSGDGGASFAVARRGPERRRGAESHASQSDAAPRAAIDLSHGPYRGRIYLTWVDYHSDSKKYVVQAAWSADTGKTWSVPVTVNDNDNQGEPANPAIAVNRDGVVAVVFNDRRDDPSNRCYRLYVAASVDGGATFLPNVKASDAPTCPNAAGNWAPSGFAFLDSPLDLATEPRRWVIAISGVAERWANGGDTQGLVADSAGVFHVAWINGVSGTMQLWATQFSIDPRMVPKAIAPVSRADLTEQLALVMTQPTVDFATHTVSVTARIANRTATPVHGPFAVVLDRVESSLAALHVVNADNSRSATGASWDFVVPGAATLQPGQQSDARVLRWGFSGDPPVHPDEPLRAHFSILGPPPTG